MHMCVLFDVQLNSIFLYEITTLVLLRHYLVTVTSPSDTNKQHEAGEIPHSLDDCDAKHDDVEVMKDEE